MIKTSPFFRRVHLAADLDVVVDGESVSVETIGEETLYNVFSNTDYASHDLELKAEKGFRIYTFTFG